MLVGVVASWRLHNMVGRHADYSKSPDAINFANEHQTLQIGVLARRLDSQQRL